jgi:hypothetical protein
MSQPQTITIDNVKYVREDSIRTLAEPSVNGEKYCIIRCRNAGVHAGYVMERDGSEVTLALSRRLWRWHGRTLSGLALEGTTDANSCKYAPEIPEITLLDACEIIPCTKEGKKSIQEMKEWSND